MAPAASKVLYDTSSWKGLLRTFLTSVTSETRGKVLVSIWTTFVLTSLLVLPSYSLVKGSKDDEPCPKTGKRRPKGADSLSKLVDVLKKQKFSRHSMFFLSYILTLCTRVLITVRLADYGGFLGSYMGAKDWRSMFVGQANLGIWFMVGAVATAAMKFLEKRVTLSVREILYDNMLVQYMNKDSILYYHAGVEDAPARFTNDIDEFSTFSVRTLGHILKPLIDVIYLSYTIASRIGKENLAIFLSFFFVAQKMIANVKRVLPKSLKQLATQKQEIEAALRTHHEQLHQYREQVALQAGTEAEFKALQARHKKVIRHQLLTSYVLSVVDVLNTYVLKYGGAMCAFSVLIPEVYFSDPNTPAHKITAHYLSNITLLQTLATEIKDMAEAFTDVNRVRGLADRLGTLKDKMDTAKAQGVKQDNCERSTCANDEIHISDLTVVPPAREGHKGEVKPLVRHLSMDIKKGEHVVIRGPNGVGKTSLFRTLCGLWGAEAGKVEMPSDKSSVFAVSQDCYFPGGVTLRGQISYPKDSGLVQDAEELLLSVGLPDFVPKLDEVGVDWRARLSGGQKQRLSFARMLFHNPTFAFIDEGTSQVDFKGCKLLHETAKTRGITLVSISHHASVDGHHDKVLDFMGGDHGEYKLGTIEK